MKEIKGNASVEFPKMGITLNLEVIKNARTADNGAIAIVTSVADAKAAGANAPAAPAAPAAGASAPSASAPAAPAKPRLTYTEIAQQATAKAGVDYIAMGSGTFARRKEDGTYEVVTDDPIIRSISEKGLLWNSRLFMQHVLAQVLRQMDTHETYKDWRGEIKTRQIPYQKVINALPFEYMLQMMLDMSSRMAAMYHDKDARLKFVERWYTKELYRDVILAYVEALDRQVKRSGTRNCKGKPYYTIASLKKMVPGSHKNMIFVSEYEQNVIAAYKSMAEAIGESVNPGSLHYLFAEFMRRHIKVATGYCTNPKMDAKYRHYAHVDTPEAWRDAYKGFGAYWSMQNLIEFHQCRVHLTRTDGTIETLSRAESMDYLNGCLMDRNRTGEYEHKGWWFTGMLRRLIKDNGIDIAKFRKEWKR